MSDQNSTQQAIERLDTMSDDELAAWIEAGDFTALGDVRLSDDDASRIAGALADAEVAGYSMGLGIGSHLTSMTSPNPPLGGHVESHKAGLKQQEFLRITIKDVLLSGLGGAL